MILDVNKLVLRQTSIITLREISLHNSGSVISHLYLVGSSVHTLVDPPTYNPLLYLRRAFICHLMQSILS